MLVIGRKLDQKISIRVGEEEIEVMLVRIKGKQARIGIKADPNKVKIKRFENLNTGKKYDRSSR